MSTITLNQMSVGQYGTIEDLSGQDAVCHRLLEMGITRGTPIEVVRFAPMGDPIDIKVRGYHLSLRRQEAQAICVAVEEDMMRKN